LGVIWRLLRFVRPYWAGLAVSLALVLLLSTLRLGPAWFVKLTIDVAIPQADLGLAAL
jgi:hypothetical protein